MKLTVIGSSGSFGGPGNPCSSYLVEHDGHRVLLDFGNGALGELQRYGDIYDLQAVILSHLHADHCVDMCGYYVARKYRPGGEPLPLLPVWGPSGTRERIAKAYDTDDAECESVFTFRDVLEGAPEGATGNTFETGPFTVRVTRVDHPVEAYAIRLEAGGHTLVYSGDTGPCAALDHLAKGADLLLAEASFQEPRDDGLLGPAPQRPRGRRERDRRRRRPPGADPHPAVDRRRAEPGRRQGRLRRPGEPGHARRGVPDLRP